MKQIGLAFHNYHSVHKSLPPAYTVDAQGNRLHSWRTFLLPFLEEQDLFETIDLAKPWNDPVNRDAMQRVVRVYQCPSHAASSPLPTLSSYVAIVDPSGVMTGSTPTKFPEVKDGLPTTVLITEVSIESAVHWMDPTDIDLDEFLGVGKEFSSNHNGAVNVMMCDGAVQHMANDTDDEYRKSIVTKSGVEQIQDPMSF